MATSEDGKKKVAVAGQASGEVVQTLNPLPCCAPIEGQVHFVGSATSFC